MIPEYLKNCEPLTEEEITELEPQYLEQYNDFESIKRLLADWCLLADWYRYQELLHVAKYTYRQFCSLSKHYDIVQDLEKILNDLGIDTKLLSQGRE